MPDDTRVTLYFSHSWRPRDVDLNVAVWQSLRDQCELVVDVPEELGADPPYYINRIEERLRRSDLFVNVLTHREPGPPDAESADSMLRCSPYSLFEIRLAERADIPRLVLYERSTGFKAPRVQRLWEAYLPFDRDPRGRLPDQVQWRRVVEPKIRKWKDWTIEHARPANYEQSTNAVILVDEERDAALADVLETCLRDGGYEPVRCGPASQRSGDGLRQLREAGLVIADFTALTPRLEQLYAIAHGLGVPAVRLLRADPDAKLPWILLGDPGGYPRDIVKWSTPGDLRALVQPRIAAMFKVSEGFRDDQAVDYFESKHYAHLLVFLSHTLKPPHRALVERIFTRLAERHVTPFEYHEVNTAGVDWKQMLDQSLGKTTHFVPLLSDGYEASQTCTYELEKTLARGAEVTILPFMIDGRSVPHTTLAHMHHTLLDGPDPDANAVRVVEQVMAALDRAVSTPTALA